MHDFLDTLYEVIRIYAWTTGIMAILLLCYYLMSPYQNCKRDFVKEEGDIGVCVRLTSF